MATNLSLDPALLGCSVARTRARGQRRAHKEGRGVASAGGVHARRKQKRLIELMGKLDWDDSFAIKAERSRK
jgi:hypothetical protein